jgi:hypothetical protein
MDEGLVSIIVLLHTDLTTRNILVSFLPKTPLSLLQSDWDGALTTPIIQRGTSLVCIECLPIWNVKPPDILDEATRSPEEWDSDQEVLGEAGGVRLVSREIRSWSTRI